MLNLALCPNVHDCASMGIISAPGGVHRRLWHISISKNMNFAPPVRNATRTEGKSTPGQKNHAGRGVIVISHIVVVAIAPDPAEM
mmetsp:Transcript_42707/g.129750  ORF Transcript_42707/g.129750 Transcript_42707/m.129750 type:complete len:85 (-) Transcript_42707:675-929(-)